MIAHAGLEHAHIPERVVAAHDRRHATVGEAMTEAALHPARLHRRSLAQGKEVRRIIRRWLVASVTAVPIHAVGDALVGAPQPMIHYRALGMVTVRRLSIG